MTARILLVTQDDAFLEELKTSLNLTDNFIRFSNKYFSAGVEVSFSLDPSNAIGCEAIVVHKSKGIDFARYFNAAESASVRVLITEDDLARDWCVANSVELFHWAEEEDVKPGDRLRSALECHPWATEADDSENGSIDFEELTDEMRKVRERSKHLTDEERREAAAKTALKMLKYFGLSEDEEDAERLVIT